VVRPKPFSNPVKLNTLTAPKTIQARRNVVTEALISIMRTMLRPNTHTRRIQHGVLRGGHNC